MTNETLEKAKGILLMIELYKKSLEELKHIHSYGVLNLCGSTKFNKVQIQTPISKEVYDNVYKYIEGEIKNLEKQFEIL